MVFGYAKGISSDILDISEMTSGQLRAARAMLGWTAQQLADASGVGVATIRRAELKKGDAGMGVPIVRAIKAAFDAAGVQFIEQNGGGEGVRRKEPSQ